MSGGKPSCPNTNQRDVIWKYDIKRENSKRIYPDSKRSYLHGVEERGKSGWSLCTAGGRFGQELVSGAVHCTWGRKQK